MLASASISVPGAGASGCALGKPSDCDTQAPELEELDLDRDPELDELDLDDDPELEDELVEFAVADEGFEMLFFCVPVFASLAFLGGDSLSII